ncbi:MAG: hypothetical protein ACFFBD_08280 [Candidatus Hodarchaeota archaeon]
MANTPVADDTAQIVQEEQIEDSELLFEEFKGTPSLFRKIKFEITAIRAEFNHIRKRVFRDILKTWNMEELLILSTIFIILLVSAGILTLLILPLLAWIIDLLGWFPIDAETGQKLWQLPDANGVVADNPFQWLFDIFLGIWRTAIFAVGAVFAFISWVIRMRMKPIVIKFRDKINARPSGMTYVFGTSQYAEAFLKEVIHLYGNEDWLVHIADCSFLWVEGNMAFVDTYVVENIEEFSRPNFYELLGFQNAERILILTEDPELNQSILTFIRGQTEAEIIMLEQFAPAFLKLRLVKDPKIKLIDDVKAITDNLILSISLDMRFPKCLEMDVPRIYFGMPASNISCDIGGIEILKVKRGEEYLDPDTETQLGDRLITYVTFPFDFKRTARITVQLPPKERKKRSRGQKAKAVSESSEVPKAEKSSLERVVEEQ